jgi:hypothetical protein
MPRVCRWETRRLDCLPRKCLGHDRRENSGERYAAGEQPALGEHELAQPDISRVG